MNAEIAEKLDEIRKLCALHEVAQLELIGSAARGFDFEPDLSDFDFLVTFKVEDEGTFFARRYFAFADDMQRLFRRTVQVHHGSSPRVKGSEQLWASIDSDREPVYDSLRAKAIAAITSGRAAS